MDQESENILVLLGIFIFEVLFMNHIFQLAFVSLSSSYVYLVNNIDD